MSKKPKIKLAKGLVRFYILTQSKLIGCRNTVAWTSFWNTIYFMNKKDMKNKKIIKHEMQHIKQYQKEGKLKFSIKYIYYTLKYGYYNNPYEVEARKVAR